jgi:hypothetical protein
MRFKKLAIFLIVVLSPTGVPLTQAQPRTAKLVSFPEHSRALSPDGRYLITGVDSDSEPYHTVFLEDRRLKTRRKLFNYNRGIELLWNPDSTHFVLNDYVGSDYSECKIIPVDEKVQPTNVWGEIVKGIRPKEQRSLLENHHVYIAAREWIAPDTLRVKVWGYGDLNPSGFTRFYTYNKKLGVKRVKP